MNKSGGSIFNVKRDVIGDCITIINGCTLGRIRKTGHCDRVWSTKKSRLSPCNSRCIVTDSEAPLIVKLCDASQFDCLGNGQIIVAITSNANVIGQIQLCFVLNKSGSSIFNVKRDVIGDCITIMNERTLGRIRKTGHGDRVWSTKKRRLSPCNSRCIVTDSEALLIVKICDASQFDCLGNSQIIVAITSNANVIGQIQICFVLNKSGSSIFNGKRHGGAVVWQAGFDGV